MPYSLPDFNQLHILVVGDVMLDRYWQGGVSRISPEAPVPVVNIQTDKTSLGGAANVARVLKDLGCQISLYGRVGQDDSSAILLKLLADKAIENHLLVDNTFKTITKLRIIDRSLHQQLIRLDFEPDAFRVDSSALIDSLYQDYCRQINHEKVDAVILSDYAKNTVLRDPQRFIQPARQAGIPVFVDPKRADLEAYHGATVLTPNTKEFTVAVGRCAGEADFVEKGLQVVKAHKFAGLLITRGADGMLLLQPGEPALQLEAHSREIFDVTGAGDVVIALLAAGYSSGLPLSAAVKLANLGAGLVVRKLGTASLSVSELQSKLELKQEGAEKKGILSLSESVDVVQAARQRGQRVVFTNGCFDILHQGHVAYLNQARALGDCLIVGVNDDASVARLKGNGRPLNTLAHRLAVLAALRSVDWVVPFREDTPLTLIKTLSPDVLVKGGDYTVDTIVGADIVKGYGGEVKVLRYLEGVSTTAMIRKAVAATL